MDSFLGAQADMRDAYFSGSAGTLTSASAWLVAALVVLFVSPKTGIWTLIFVGMLIFPLSVLLCKILGRSGKHHKDNPLGPLALEGTVWMLLGIILAFGLSLYKIEWFFPAMLLVIGGRYLTFATLYGMKVYHLLGATLIAAGFSLEYFNAPIIAGAFAGALIEYAYGIFILFKCKK